MTKFGISKGHNTPYNSGATGCGYVEDNCTKDIGDRVISKLRTLGYEVVDCTPSTATSLTDSLQRRCDIANNNKVDLYVEIHMNCFSDPTAKGTEVFCNPNNSVGNDYAHKVLNELLKIGWYNRGVKDGNWLYVVKHTNMTSLLIETCFISNPNDMALYNPEKVANAIVKGLVGRLPEVTPPPQPKPEQPTPQPVNNKVKEYQHICNVLGIRDMNGNKLDEDGLIGACTRSTYSKMPILQVGSNNIVVGWVQKIVGATPIDNAYGQITKSKVMVYQKAHNLYADGIVGQNSYKALVEG